MKKLSKAFLLATVLLAGAVTSANAQVFVDGSACATTGPFYSSFTPARTGFRYASPFLDHDYGYFRSGWNHEYNVSPGFGLLRRGGGSLIDIDLF